MLVVMLFVSLSYIFLYVGFVNCYVFDIVGFVIYYICCNVCVWCWSDVFFVCDVVVFVMFVV